MIHPFAARFTYGENWELFSYIRNLRYLEYYTNKTQKPWDRVFRAFYLLKHWKNIKCMSISIAPNLVTEDVSDNVVIAGSPAKIIKFKEND